VQQKIDLAKAYEEMGDKDGAREILQEVVKEGDSEQQTQAKKLLGSLG
jgi:pilus assembly protein FimV